MNRCRVSIYCIRSWHRTSTITYGRNARLMPMVPNPHCLYTGWKPCRKMKIRLSLKPLTADSQATIGL